MRTTHVLTAVVATLAVSCAWAQQPQTQRLAGEIQRVEGNVIFAKGRPLAIGTTGKRPDLKRISGQEKLPVLALTDGTTVNGSDAVVAWARERLASAH